VRQADGKPAVDCIPPDVLTLEGEVTIIRLVAVGQVLAATPKAVEGKDDGGPDADVNGAVRDDSTNKLLGDGETETALTGNGAETG